MDVTCSHKIAFHQPIASSQRHFFRRNFDGFKFLKRRCDRQQQRQPKTSGRSRHQRRRRREQRRQRIDAGSERPTSSTPISQPQHTSTPSIVADRDRQQLQWIANANKKDNRQSTLEIDDRQATKDKIRPTIDDPQTNIDD